MPEESLEVLREAIDKTDAQIIDLLAQRFAATEAVGTIKANAGLDAVSEAREQQQETRFRELAELKGLNPDMVVRVFRLIIDEVVSNHRELARKART